MNRSEPRIDVEATEEARVVLSIPQGNRARTLAPEHARDLAGILLEAAEAAQAHRAALGQLGPKRNRPNARPAYDGRVRLSLGNVYVDVDVAEALRHAEDRRHRRGARGRRADHAGPRRPRRRRVRPARRGRP